MYDKIFRIDDLEFKIDDILNIAWQAGKEIMEIYKKDFEVEYKDDKSPLTQADKNSHEIIKKELNKYNLPLLSEESKSIPYEERKNWDLFWMIDPIDGTKEFIKKNDEFTINIALIKNNTPIFGIVYAPAIDEIYFTDNQYSYKATLTIDDFELQDIKKLPFVKNKDKFVIVASKSHLNDETKKFIENIKTDKEKKFISKGSSLKLCMVATGIADIYPRLAPTMEWDIAAGDAILRKAGGGCFNFADKYILRYNKKSLINKFLLCRKNYHILLVSSKYQPEYSGSGLRAHNTYKRLENKFGIKWDIISNSISFLGNSIYVYDNKRIYRISSPFNIPNRKSIKRSILIIFDMIWQMYFSWRFIKKKINEYDILHTFGNSWSIGFLTWYFDKHNKAIIRELCNEMPNPLYPIQFQRTMKNIFQKKNTLVIAISKKLEKLARKYHIKNVWTRPNPIDETRFFVEYEKKYLFRKKLTRFTNKDIVLLYIANFRESKNHLFLLEVLKVLPSHYKLVIGGPLKETGKLYYQVFLETIENYHLENRVQVIKGFVSNIDEYIKMSDVFLFPSLSEGLGTPILEAQACGVPVISNYLEDIVEDIIKKGEGGFYQKLNVDKWVIAIQRAVNIPKRTLIENAKYIYNIASSKRIDNKYYQKFEEVLNG